MKVGCAVSRLSRSVKTLLRRTCPAGARSRPPRFSKGEDTNAYAVRSRKDEVLLCKAWKQPQGSRESGMQSVIGGVANVNRAAESAHSGSLVACSWNSLVSPRLSIDVGAMETRSTTGSSA